MKKYKNFINEEKVWYKNIELDEDEVKKLLDGPEYSDFNPDDKPIYRSFHFPFEYGIMKNIKERRSAYADNYYTLLINNLPSWKEYPKRQIICTDVPFRYRANNVYRIIPKNGAKIGICPSDDIQADFPSGKLSDELKLDGIFNLSQFNDILLYIPYKYETIKNKKPKSLNTFPDNNWKTFINNLKKYNEKYIELKSDSEIYENHKEYIDKVIKYTDINELNRLINPELGFEVYDYKDYAKAELKEPFNMMHYENSYQHEIWLDSDILLVPQNYFDK